MGSCLYLCSIPVELYQLCCIVFSLCIWCVRAKCVCSTHTFFSRYCYSLQLKVSQSLCFYELKYSHNFPVFYSLRMPKSPSLKWTSVLLEACCPPIISQAKRYVNLECTDVFSCFTRLNVCLWPKDLICKLAIIDTLPEGSWKLVAGICSRRV